MDKEIDGIEKALFIKEDIEQQWLDEAERRLLDYRSGKGFLGDFFLKKVLYMDAEEQRLAV